MVIFARLMSSPIRAIWKHWLFCVWTINILETECSHDNHVISLSEFVLLKCKSKVISDCYVFKFSQCSVDRRHLMRFQSEISVFKFLRRSVDGKHLIASSEWNLCFQIPSPSVDGVDNKANRCRWCRVGKQKSEKIRKIQCLKISLQLLA